MTETTHSILIVEDEKPLARALQIKFQKNGYEAKTASNGEEALSMLEKEKFDLILLDMLMPGIDGWKFLKQTKEVGGSTPIVVVSNLSQEDDINEAKELGAVDYLVKSDVTLTEIIDKSKMILEQ